MGGPQDGRNKREFLYDLQMPPNTILLIHVQFLMELLFFFNAL